MFKPNQIRALTLLSCTLVVLASGVKSSAAQEAASAIPLAKSTATGVTPAMHRRDGKAFGIIISVPNCPSAATNINDKWTLATAAGSGLSIQDTAFIPPCELTGTLLIDPSASPGDQAILIKDDQQAIKSTLRIGVVDSLPGPIPPGLAPQVEAFDRY